MSQGNSKPQHPSSIKTPSSESTNRGWRGWSWIWMEPQRHGGGSEAPNPNIQAPRNLKTSRPNLVCGVWSFTGGWSLDVGVSPNPALSRIARGCCFSRSGLASRACSLIACRRFETGGLKQLQRRREGRENRPQLRCGDRLQTQTPQSRGQSQSRSISVKARGEVPAVRGNPCRGRSRKSEHLALGDSPRTGRTCGRRALHRKNEGWEWKCAIRAGPRRISDGVRTFLLLPKPSAENE